MNPQDVLTHGEVTVPGIENPVFYEVVVPHPMTTVVSLLIFFALAAIIVSIIERALTNYRRMNDNFYPDLPDPDYSTEREIHKAHKRAIYSARIRKQS